MIELVSDIPELKPTYIKVIQNAIQRGLITEKEWNSRFKNYRDKYGYSFVHYLECISNEIDNFITNNKIMLDNSDELFKRFGVRVCTIDDMVKEMERKNAKKS